jgi:phenylacetate-CoA ligase
VIHPESGVQLPEGEEGELVLTSLTREALPVIRYRTRDRTRLLLPTVRAMRRLARIRARTDDMLIVRGVNVYPTQIEELILKHGRLAPHYVLELTRAAQLDELAVHAELLAGIEATPVVCGECSEDLARQIKAYIGVSARVLVAGAGTLERSLGKARRVIDRRKL